MDHDDSPLNPQRGADFPAKEAALFRQLTDGVLKPEQFREIEVRLLADPEFRQRYVEFIRFETSLPEALSDVREAPSPPPQIPSLRRPRQSTPFWPALAGAALCSMLFGLGFWVFSFRTLPPEKHVPKPESSSIADNAAAANASRDPQPSFDVAVVTSVENHSVATSPLSIKPGDLLKGGMIRIGQARIQIDFLNGVQVVLEGPAELEISSINSATLISGRAVTKVPKSAQGFVLKGPFSAVVDLGTEFAMNVAQDGTSEVYVLDGEVEVSLVGDDGSTLQSQRLLQSETVRLSKAMERVEPISGPSGLVAHIGRRVVSTLEVSDRYAQRVLSDGAEIYWRFETAEGDTIPNSAGHSHGARIYPAAGAEHGVVVEQGQLTLSASSTPRYVEAVDPIENLNSQEYSIEMWVRPELFHHGLLLGVIPVDDPIPLKHLTILELAHQTSLVHVPGAFRFLHRHPSREAGGLNLFTHQSCVPGQWHHLVSVKTRNELRFYLNGKLVRQIATRRASDSHPYKILLGQIRRTDHDRQFIGAIDELAVYKRALSEEDITQHFRMISAPPL